MITTKFITATLKLLQNSCCEVNNSLYCVQVLLEYDLLKAWTIEILYYNITMII